MRTNGRGVLLQCALPRRSSLPILVSAAAILAAPLAAQGGNGLVLHVDPANVVASSLVGAWRLDARLKQRLGGEDGGFGERLVFRADAAVLAKVPETYAERVRDNPIFLAGTMTRGGHEHPFLLTSFRGNATLLWFHEVDRDPFGGADSNILMLARGAVGQADLLFVGGDSTNGQPFAAYARELAPAPRLTAAAALAQMIALLEAGRTRELVTTWCTPDDLEAVAKDPEAATAAMVASLQGDRGKELLALLRAASAEEPTTDEAGDVAHWEIEPARTPGPGTGTGTGQGIGKPKQVRLQRIDGRWYLRTR